MTAPTPIDRVAEILLGAGYRPVPMPLDIAGLKFDLPMVFVGTAPSPDLILVADTAFDEEHRILRKIEGLTRAMDVMQSKRPVTLVIAGPRPTSATLDSMSRVCRVLPIGTIFGENPDEALRNWLAVLMPLNLPEPSVSIADPLAEIMSQLGGLQSDVASLVEVAQQGADAVQTRLLKIISEPLADENEGNES
jgi:hypothetical protein